MQLSCIVLELELSSESELISMIYRLNRLYRLIDEKMEMDFKLQIVTKKKYRCQLFLPSICQKTDFFTKFTARSNVC